jgi:hypothetical protein
MEKKKDEAAQMRIARRSNQMRTKTTIPRTAEGMKGRSVMKSHHRISTVQLPFLSRNDSFFGFKNIRDVQTIGIHPGKAYKRLS